jgi:hypothetical protein
MSWACLLRHDRQHLNHFVYLDKLLAVPFVVSIVGIDRHESLTDGLNRTYQAIQFLDSRSYFKLKGGWHLSLPHTAEPQDPPLYGDVTQFWIAEGVARMAIDHPLTATAA